jgi:hypothetical protein
MGILRKGIFGGFKNKTGGLVGRMVGGKNVITALPHKSLKDCTEAQVSQQQKFELILTTLKWFSSLIEIGFKHAKDKGSAFNACVKFNYNRILIGVAPDYNIDYSKLIYSKGSLVGAAMPMLSLITGGIRINWLPDMETRFNRNTDKASFVAFCVEKEMILIYRDLATRADLQVVLSLSAHAAQDNWHIWMHFENAQGNEVSNSAYLGNYMINL